MPMPAAHPAPTPDSPYGAAALTVDAQGAIPGEDRLSRTEQLGILETALNKAVQIPSVTIRSHVNRLQARNPMASPAQIIEMLEKEYLGVIQTAGGAVGAAAAFPSIGTGAGIALTASDIATFFAASAAFTLAVADVHGIEVDDAGRRRALLLTTILDTDGAKAFSAAGVAASGGSPTRWARVILTTMPTGTIRQVNKALTGKYLRRFLARQTGLALGRLIPFGVGAGVGVLGARALGRHVIGQARLAFGPAPYEFGVPVRVIETGSVPLILPSLHDGSEESGR